MKQIFTVFLSVLLIALVTACSTENDNNSAEVKQDQES